MVIEQRAYVDSPFNVGKTKGAMAIKNAGPHGAAWNGLFEDNATVGIAGVVFMVFVLSLVRVRWAYEPAFGGRG